MEHQLCQRGTEGRKGHKGNFLKHVPVLHVNYTSKNVKF